MVTNSQVRILMKLVNKEELLKTAAAKAGMSEKTARKYRKSAENLCLKARKYADNHTCNTLTYTKLSMFFQEQPKNFRTIHRLCPFCPKTTGAYTELISIGPELVQKPLAISK